MGKIKIGVQLYSLRGMMKDEKSVANVFKQVKAMGAEVVQLSGGCKLPAETFAKISKDYDLPICITHDPVDRIENDLDKLAEEHLIYGCKNMGVGMMPVKYRTGKKEDIDKFVFLLNYAAEKLKKYGMTVAYHNHWFEFNEIEGRLIYDKLISDTLPEVQFIPDTFWYKFKQIEPDFYIEKLSGRINTLHLKDYKKTLGVPVFRAVGRGIIDFGRVLKTAEAAGVENAVVELDLSPNPIESIKYSLDCLNNIYKIGES